MDAISFIGGSGDHTGDTRGPQRASGDVRRPLVARDPTLVRGQRGKMGSGGHEEINALAVRRFREYGTWPGRDFYTIHPDFELLYCLFDEHAMTLQRLSRGHIGRKRARDQRRVAAAGLLITGRLDG